MKPRIALALVLVSAAMLTLGGLFKLLHWPTANIQLLLGTLVHVAALLALAGNVLRRQGLKELVEG
ncbi:MAG: hypothetical protein QM724_13090 [Flavobacteriales bacterium]